MNLKESTEHIIARMENELPRHLYYHSLAHVEDVMTSAKIIASTEAVSDYEMKLLESAIAFHDCGFIYQAQNHEDIGCGIARETLPKYGYTTEEIEIICGMIMATKIPQSPKTILEKIICDADLDYLGRDDFWAIGKNLFHELKESGVLKTENEWNIIQQRFLNNHNFFTKFAIENREAKKQLHLKKVIELIQS